MAGTRAGGAGGAKPRALKRAGCPFSLSEETSLSVDPGRPVELFVENIPQGPRVTLSYNAPILPPVSRSIKTFQNL